MAAAKKATKKRARPAAKRSAKKPAKKAATRARALKHPAKKGPGSARVSGLPKAEGAGAVEAFFKKIPDEHRAIGKRIDAIMAANVPDLARAIKWSTPMYGVKGKWWIAGFASFKNYTKVNFFAGAKLTPPPPEGDGKGMRSVNIASLDELDEKQMASWVRQAAAIPGWGKA